MVRKCRLRSLVFLVVSCAIECINDKVGAFRFLKELNVELNNQHRCRVLLCTVGSVFQTMDGQRKVF